MHTGNLKQAVIIGDINEVRQILDVYPDLVNKKWTDDCAKGYNGMYSSYTYYPHTLAMEHWRLDVAKCLANEYNCDWRCKSSTDPDWKISLDSAADQGVVIFLPLSTR